MGPFWPLLNDGSGMTLVAQQAPLWRGLDLTLVFADLATFAAYAVIPLLILYFLLRRRHVHFSRVWFLLVVYLIVGGAGRVLDAFGDCGTHTADRRGAEGGAGVRRLDLGASC